MALEQITFNIAAFKDSDAAGNNYYAGVVYEVFNINDTLADIFSDSAGTSPIAQDGISNASDSTGKALFYIGKGAYYALSGGERRDFETSVSALDLRDENAKYNPETIQVAIDSTEWDVTGGELIRVQGYYAPGVGGGTWKTIVAGVTVDVDLPNGTWIRQCAGVPTLAVKLVIYGEMNPEQFGSDGTATNDSLAAVEFLKQVRNQRWTPGKTYNLDTAVIGDTRGFKVLSNTEMVGYGATVDMQGASNNGFYFGPENGVLKAIRLAGFSFTQVNAASITNAMLIEGFIEDSIIEDNTCDGMDQYFIGMGGDASGYKNLTVRNNFADNINPQADNQFSLCYEFFPKVASSQLYFHDNYGRQIGNGGVFKIHTCDGSFIHDNKFIRTTNTGISQSQAVMLGGRATHPISNTHFHDNMIDDANVSLGALFVGNNSNNTSVIDNEIGGAGSTIWVGTSITDSKIAGNAVDSIYSLGSTSAISNLTIEDNTVDAIDFSAPPAGSKPDTIDGLFIKKNNIKSRVRLDVTTSSDNIKIHYNDLDEVASTSSLLCDNISFKYNNVTVDGGWVAGSQVVNVGAVSGFRQMNNTWNLKGLVSQSTWLNGSTGAQVIGETVEDAVTRIVLDNGTSSEFFGNRLKLNGGVWSNA